MAKRGGDALDRELERRYRDAIYCSSTQVQEDGVIQGHYCKQSRWCPNCNAIRTAIAINHYAPVVASWEDAHMVTLTRQAVQGGALGHADGSLPGGVYKDSLAAFNRAKDSMRKSRTAPLKLVGIRSTECTYNVLEDWYHPHYHCIVETREMAERLRDGWLGQFPVELARPGSQHVRPIDERGLVEAMKYCTKLIVKDKDANKQYVPAAALHTIFRSLRRGKLIQPIGFTVPKEVLNADEDFETEDGIPAVSRLAESILWEWEQDVTDWVDNSTGDTLSGYEPDAEDAKLIRSWR